jgi:hypothetical protein
MNTDRHQRLNLAPSAARGRYLSLCILALALAAAAFALRPAGAQSEKMIVLRPATEGVNMTVQIAPPLTGGATYSSLTVVQGTLPPGLAVTSAGKLEGVPTAPRNEPYQFKVSLVTPSGATRTVWISLVVREFFPASASLVPAPTPPPGPAAVPAPQPDYEITTTTNDEETIALSETYPAPAPPDVFAEKDFDNKDLIENMINQTIGTSATHFQVDDYCAVDVIKWRPLIENKSEPEREIWALFKAEAVDGGLKWVPQRDPKNKDLFSTRVYGSKRVAVLLVHLNTPSSWDIKYKVSITKKVPTPIQNVLDLIGNISAAGGGDERAIADTKDIFGARLMLTRYASSEIVVKLNAVTAGPGGRPVEQSKEHTNTFINEGRYHWDVSVGLPIKNVREVTYKAETGRVSAEAKDRQSVYGFFNFYPWAVDLKGEGGRFFTPPHLVFGVPLASKPLHHPFVGVGTGLYKMPIKFNIFAGVVFNRERVPRTLAEGTAATTGQLETDLHTRWVRKFMFGINLPVSQIKDAIKKAN